MGLVILNSWAVRNQASPGKTMQWVDSKHVALVWVPASQEWRGGPGFLFPDELKQHRGNQGAVYKQPPIFKAIIYLLLKGPVTQQRVLVHFIVESENSETQTDPSV